VIYLRGMGVAANTEEALKWLRRAAQHGSAAAENQLAYAYEHGLGVGQDLNAAAKWYRTAAEHGFADARAKLEILPAIVHEVSRPRSGVDSQSFVGMGSQAGSVGSNPR